MRRQRAADDITPIWVSPDYQLTTIEHARVDAAAGAAPAELTPGRHDAFSTAATRPPILGFRFRAIAASIFRALLHSVDDVEISIKHASSSAVRRRCFTSVTLDDAATLISRQVALPAAATHRWLVAIAAMADSKISTLAGWRHRAAAFRFCFASGDILPLMK